MSMKPDILQELQQLAPTLVNIPRQPVFEVPEGYFEQLSGQVMLALNKQQATRQQVPQGYFEGLAGSIMQRIKEEAAAQEDPEYSALLSSIGRQMPFAVPAGYFEGLAGSIGSKVDTATPARVVTMHKSRSSAGWLKYAAAACVIGLLGFFSVRLLNNTGGAAGTAKENMIIAGTTMSYKQIMDMNVDAEIQKVSSTELNNYLCLNNVIACNEPADESLQKQLSEISDEEIDAFLEAQN